ncbi:hypothetical protein ACOME3_003983 [Neoechinorhynchus agilis]
MFPYFLSKDLNFSFRIYDEVAAQLKKMKTGRSAGPDNITIELWQSLGVFGIKLLTRLFQKIDTEEKIPSERQRKTAFGNARMHSIRHANLEATEDLAPRGIRLIIRVQCESISISTGVGPFVSVTTVVSSVKLDGLDEDGKAG